MEKYLNLIKRPRLETETISQVATSISTASSSTVNVPVSLSSETEPHRLDIGKYVELTNISDSLRAELLTINKPFKNYNFIADVEKGNRPFLYNWLERYESWLVYSESAKGPFCKFCVLFRPPLKRGLFGSFIDKACLKYKDFHAEAKKHINSQWHKDSLIAAKNFQQVIENKQINVVEQLNTADHIAIENNRKKLNPIVSTLIFLWYT